MGGKRKRKRKKGEKEEETASRGSRPTADEVDSEDAARASGESIFELAAM